MLAMHGSARSARVALPSSHTRSLTLPQFCRPQILSASVKVDTRRNTRMLSSRKSLQITGRGVVACERAASSGRKFQDKPHPVASSRACLLVRKFLRFGRTFFVSLFPRRQDEQTNCEQTIKIQIAFISIHVCAVFAMRDEKGKSS